MENRDRDKVSRRTKPTEAGEINREVSEREGREHDSSAEFGQKIGRSEEMNSPERESSDRGRPLVDLSGRSEGNH
jgi:hypothetical protein